MKKNILIGLVGLSLISSNLYALEVDNNVMKKLSDVSVKLIEKQKENEIKYESLYKMNKKIDKKVSKFINENKKNVSTNIKNIKVDLLKKEVADSKLEIEISENASNIKMIDLKIKDIEKKLKEHTNILKSNDKFNFEKILEMNKNLSNLEKKIKKVNDYFNKINKEVNTNIVTNAYEDHKKYESMMSEIKKASEKERKNRNLRIEREMEKQNKINSELNKMIATQKAIIDKQNKELNNLKNNLYSVKEVKSNNGTKISVNHTNNSISDSDMDIIDNYINDKK